MAKSRKEVAQDLLSNYIEGVLGKVPAEQREAVKQALLDESGLDTVGGRHLETAEQAEKLRQEALAFQSQLTDWYGKTVAEKEQGSAALQKLEALGKAGINVDNLLRDPKAIPQGGERTPPPPQLPADLMTKAEAAAVLAKLTQDAQNNVGGYVDKMLKLSASHQNDFGKPLDLDGFKAFADQRRGQYPSWEAAYSDFTREARSGLEKKRQEEHDSKIKDEAMKEAMDKLRKEQSLPWTANLSEPGEGTSLIGLQGDKASFGVKAALEAFNSGQYRKN